MPPISPVSRGPHQDLVSDSGDRMDLDETPAPTEAMVNASHPRMAEPPSTERTNGPQTDGILPRAISRAPFERQEQANNSRRDPAKAEERRRRLGELHEMIKKYPKILEEYHGLCQEEREEYGEAGQNWPQYEYLFPIGGSEISTQTMPLSKGRNSYRYQSSQNKDRSTGRESQLNRIAESDRDLMEHEASRPYRNSNSEGHSHALRAYVGQLPTDESPISRILSSGNTASTTTALTAPSVVSTIQAESQGALISPPVSVASPQAAVTEISQSHERRPSAVIPDVGMPAAESARPQRRGSSGISPSVQPTQTLQQNSEKSIPCPHPSCDKMFSMPSKVK